jgi:hypothetical protein
MRGYKIMAIQQDNLNRSEKNIPHLIPGFLNRFASAPKHSNPQPDQQKKTRTQTVPSVAAMRRCHSDGSEIGFD